MKSLPPIHPALFNHCLIDRLAPPPALSSISSVSIEKQRIKSVDDEKKSVCVERERERNAVESSREFVFRRIEEQMSPQESCVLEGEAFTFLDGNGDTRRQSKSTRWSNKWRVGRLFGVLPTGPPGSPFLEKKIFIDTDVVSLVVLFDSAVVFILHPSATADRVRPVCVFVQVGLGTLVHKRETEREGALST